MTARAGPSGFTRRSVHGSSSRLRPAAQLAESDDSPSYYDTPHQTPSHPDPIYRQLNTPYPLRPSEVIKMPSPLPADVISATDYGQSTMFPSTGVIDSISMISICLRRREHIPRAFQIFNQILLDVKGAPHKMPESEIWGRMIEGVASLGEEKAGEDTWKTWRGRAAALASKWEAHANVPKGTPGLQHEGLRVYQGYLSGLIK
jgi:DNA-directed RNA polymerase